MVHLTLVRRLIFRWFSIGHSFVIVPFYIWRSASLVARGAEATTSTGDVVERLLSPSVGGYPAEKAAREKAYPDQSEIYRIG